MTNFTVELRIIVTCKMVASRAVTHRNKSLGNRIKNNK